MRIESQPYPSSLLKQEPQESSSNCLARPSGGASGSFEVCTATLAQYFISSSTYILLMHIISDSTFEAYSVPLGHHSRSFHKPKDDSSLAAACNRLLMDSAKERAYAYRAHRFSDFAYYVQAYKRVDVNIEWDGKQETLKKLLIEARKLQLLTRYGDYLAMVCTQLEVPTVTCGSRGKELPEVISKWGEITALLDDDIKRSHSKSILEFGPWITEKMKAADDAVCIPRSSGKSRPGIAVFNIRSRECGKRNIYVYQDFTRMIKARDLVGLAELLHADLTDLPAAFIATEPRERALLAAIIEKGIDKWWNRWEGFAANPRAWEHKHSLFEARKTIVREEDETGRIRNEKEEAKGLEFDIQLVDQIVHHMRGRTPKPEWVAEVQPKVSDGVLAPERLATFKLLPFFGGELN